MLTATTAGADSAGTWKAYMAYSQVQNVEQAGKRLYVLASNNLYAYNTADNSLQTYDKVNALSDCGISFISYNSVAHRLLIVYDNYNMDLMDDDGEVMSLSAYYSASIEGGKNINSVSQSGRYAYLSTVFGIVQIDMQNATIQNTFNLGMNVLWSAVENGYLCAYSYPNGKYSGLLSANLSDKSNWSRTGDYAAPPAENKDSLKAIAAKLNPGGPKYNYFAAMQVVDGKLYSCGGRWFTGAANRPGTVQVLSGDDWIIYQDSLQNVTGYPYLDLNSIAVDPTDHNHVMASGRTGIYEYRNGSFVHAYTNDTSNGILQTANGVSNNSKEYVIVNAITFDKEGNLWGFNSQAPSSNFFELTKSGEWINRNKDAFMSTATMSMGNIGQMFFDSRGLLWLCNNHWMNPYLFCYDPQTDGLNVYSSIINEDGSNLAPYYIHCGAEDLSNNIWIGTDRGPVYLSAENIRSGETTFEQVKVPRNDGTDLADYLLSGVGVTAIAVDGAGRKWFGTNGNGVYLVSEDNMTQEQHFTASNSPLLSDLIESIAIDDASGVVYFGTDKGLCSYQSNAVTPNEKMTKDNVWAYPNPVKPDYTGPITITGLSYNAYVKIVTTNGVLVNEGRSTGGMYQWDGTDTKGRRVASGVYMVMTATADGSKGVVCKVAIVR